MLFQIMKFLYMMILKFQAFINSLFALRNRLISYGGRSQFDFYKKKKFEIKENKEKTER